MRKTMIAAAIALGAATLATGALARPMGGGGHPSFSAGAHPSFSAGAHPSFSAGAHASFNAGAHPTFNAGAHPAFRGTHPGGNFAFRGGPEHGRGHFRGLFAFGGPGPVYYDYDDTYDNSYGDTESCWERRLVPTPFGLRWRLVDVCE